MNRRRATRTRLIVVGLLAAAVILAWLALRDAEGATTSAAGRPTVQAASPNLSPAAALPIKGP